LIIESFADGEVSTVEPRLHWRVRGKIHIKNYAFGLSIPPELLLHMILKGAVAPLSVSRMV